MTKMQDICPQCGSHLVLKDGQFGEFLACPRFPDCRFTRPLQATEELYKAPSPYCSKCNRTGLLPFTKNGKVIPHTFVDCECKLSLPEHYDPIRLQPSDFDFPMSDAFRDFTYQFCGQPDPATQQGFYLPKKKAMDLENNRVIRGGEGRGGLLRGEFVRRGEFVHLQAKLNKHISKANTKRIDWIAEGQTRILEGHEVTDSETTGQ